MQLSLDDQSITNPEHINALYWPACWAPTRVALRAVISSWPVTIGWTSLRCWVPGQNWAELSPCRKFFTWLLIHWQDTANELKLWHSSFWPFRTVKSCFQPTSRLPSICTDLTVSNLVRCSVLSNAKKSLCDTYGLSYCSAHLVLGYGSVSTFKRSDDAYFSTMSTF